MTKPTREQVVQWALGSGFSIGIEQVFAVDGPTLVQCTFGLEQFATLARADLEATIAEQAEIIKDLTTQDNKIIADLTAHVETMEGVLAEQAEAIRVRDEQAIKGFIHAFKRHVGGDGEFWLHELEDFAENLP